jgi:hypothetical protein
MGVAEPAPSGRSLLWRRWSARLFLVLVAVAPGACGDDGLGPSRSEIFTGTLAPPPEMPRAAGYAVHAVRLERRGSLRAQLAWTGDGALWLNLFAERPPTSEPALASSPNTPTQASPVGLAAVLGPGEYHLLVQQAIIPAGPNRGACGCVNAYTLTVSHPGP